MFVDRYVIARNLSVKGTTTYQPDMIFGLAMPTAVAGFAHKLLLDFKAATGRNISNHGTSVVVHDHHLMEGQAKCPPKDGVKAAPFSFDLRADGVISLIFAIDADENQVAADEFVAFLANALIGANFAGGKIFPGNRFSIESCIDSADISKFLSRGYALLDRQDVLTDYMRKVGVDSLDALLDISELVRQNPEAEQGEEPIFKRRLEGWLVGICVGYQAVNTPVLRAGTRINDDATKHVFAETIYSIGEYKPISSALKNDPCLITSSGFWRHCHNPETHTYFVSAKTN